MFYDGKDEDQKEEKTDEGVSAGNYNLGDEIGTKIGEGHDPIEDNSAQ